MSSGKEEKAKEEKEKGTEQKPGVLITEPRRK